jgi:hypothetical protein
MVMESQPTVWGPPPGRSAYELVSLLVGPAGVMPGVSFGRLDCFEKDVTALEEKVGDR